MNIKRAFFGDALKCFLGPIVIVLCVGSSAWAQKPKPQVRVSAWYWLNSAPKTEWEHDFRTMKHLGFTDVLLGWGLDAAAVATRKAETKQAMQWAHGAGIGAYLIVWHPQANSLARVAGFMHMDANGKQLDTFDVFNPQWRSTQWKSYLQEVAKAYGDEPAMAGYVFDDSFAEGENSYGVYEKKAFGSPLPRTRTDPGWNEWTKSRQGWWEDWAKDTVRYLRAIDAHREHVIYLEDYIGSITNPGKHADMGLDFARVAKHFDAVGGYTTPNWNSDPDADNKVSQLTTSAIEGVRKMVGPKKQIVYTFWSANYWEERKPGPAAYPSAAQIQKVCEDALKLGIRHIDMYGFRIGEYQATKEEMARMVPAEPAPYVVTGQFPRKFLWDRLEVQSDLGIYLRGLNRK